MASSLAGQSFSLFVYLLILDGAAIFFFTRGFLLTRTELTTFSNCSDLADRHFSCVLRDELRKNSTIEYLNTSSSNQALELLDDGDAEDQKAGVNDSQCWTRPAIKKAIILIIDALRFDFVAHSRNFDGERKPWMDKLSVLQREVEKKNSTALLFKFIADPPTTTLQRLKGLTTGGLPTFIDIGHSFGAPAIVEDNLLLQLARTGKRVVMMGDDTWMQLFPTQFAEAYPFPSFNVKDLHTVDDGVIRELFPALDRDNWDVLIGHFLGVDHVGHIFSVESSLMPEKLEQYNKVIEDVVERLRNRSGPGDLFEDTLLIVMGDHGQTLNGDHGGGTPEEVETALFALGTRHLSSSLLPDIFPSLCDLEDPISGCISTFSQLDFSATLAALLGVPFPFGSVGQVNADLFTLVAQDSFSVTESPDEKQKLRSTLRLIERYYEILCINSWQVRRYFESYAKVAITGFPPQDLAWLEDLYSKALNVSNYFDALECNLRSTEDVQARKEVTLEAIATLREKVGAHRDYLSAAASLARSQWTQFGIEWMAVGFLILIACVAVRAVTLYQLCHGSSQNLEKIFPLKEVLAGSLGSAYLMAVVVILHPLLSRTSFHSLFEYMNENLGIVLLGVIAVASVAAYFASLEGLSFGRITATSDDLHYGLEAKKGWSILKLSLRTIWNSLFIALHALSLFSNSYIVAEGLVIHFLIASSGILYLRYAVQAKSKFLHAIFFLGVIWLMPKIHTLAILKGVTSESLDDSAGTVDGSQSTVVLGQILMTSITILLPLTVLSWLLNQEAKRRHVWEMVNLGAMLTYVFIGVHWLMVDLASSRLLNIPDTLLQFSRLCLPRLVYAMSVLLILTTVTVGKYSCSKRLNEEVVEYCEILVRVSTAFLAGASGTIILLMGRKGPLLTLLALLEVWLFLELQTLPNTCQRSMISKQSGNGEDIKIKLPFGTTADWSLIAAQLFFSTGHSCAFDGLHYSAAFTGFDDFGFYKQGVLLATETFGASHAFPVFGLPVVVLARFRSCPSTVESKDIILEITKGYLWLGLLQAVIATVTTASVSIQRRHLMVWGIFAPKYVFDAVGFLLVDILVILATSLFFSLPGRKLHKA